MDREKNETPNAAATVTPAPCEGDTTVDLATKPDRTVTPGGTAEAEVDTGPSRPAKATVEQEATPSACNDDKAPAADGGVPARSRDMRVFRPSETPFDPRRIQLPDDFYSSTASDYKSKMDSLSGAQSTDAPMMTKKMRDAEQAKKMSRFRKVLIRVRLPDRTSLQGTFTPKSTVRDIVRFVNGALRNAKGTRFHLFVTPPKTILKNMDATLWSEGLVPAALVNLGIDSGPTESSAILSDETLSYIEDAPAQGAPVLSTTAPPVAAEAAGKASGKGRGKSSGTSKKVPKWFKTKK